MLLKSGDASALQEDESDLNLARSTSQDSIWQEFERRFATLRSELEARIREEVCNLNLKLTEASPF